MMIGWGGGLIVMALLIWLIITMVNRTGNNTYVSSQNTPKNTPLEILKERYARGEITKEEFDEMAKNLR